MRLAPLALAATLTVVLSGCDKLPSLLGKKEPPASGPVAAVPAVPVASTAAAAPATPPANGVAPPLPDVGRATTQAYNASGNGASAAEAVDEAIRMALRMANGQTVDLGSQQFKVTLSLARGRDAEALRANAFAESIVQSSGGAITGFKINRLEGPDSRGFYQADIEAQVAKFNAPADSKKLRIVVAPLRYDGSSFQVGGRSMPADKVAEDLRQQVLAALANTGRFTVLDRDLDSEVNQELELISSGQAPRAEFGKLGQALSADVIWVGRINSFAYNRHARQLQTSDRELVSYDGGWAVSQKLVNVSTRQVMLSDALRGTAPGVAPTTLGTGVDGERVGNDMRNDIAARIVAGIMSRTFPVTVISREGNSVVLSQGGQAVRENQRYRLVYMGKEMFDPQTSQSLGRMESDCCEVVVDRVMPGMAQGHLDKLQMSLDGFQPGSLQLREPVATLAAAAAPAATGTAPARPRPAAGGAQRPEPARPAAPAAAARDDKW